MKSVLFCNTYLIILIYSGNHLKDYKIISIYYTAGGGQWLPVEGADGALSSLDLLTINYFAKLHSSTSLLPQRQITYASDHICVSCIVQDHSLGMYVCVLDDSFEFE